MKPYYCFWHETSLIAGFDVSYSNWDCFEQMKERIC